MRVSRIELKLAQELIFKTVALAAHKLCTMNEAKSDLINVLSSLEAHWHVLEAEVVEINRDIEYCEQCLRKYGEWFVRRAPQRPPRFACAGVPRALCPS